MERTENDIHGVNVFVTPSGKSSSRHIRGCPILSICGHFDRLMKRLTSPMGNFMTRGYCERIYSTQSKPISWPKPDTRSGCVFWLYAPSNCVEFLFPSPPVR